MAEACDGIKLIRVLVGCVWRKVDFSGDVFTSLSSGQIFTRRESMTSIFITQNIKYCKKCPPV